MAIEYIYPSSDRRFLERLSQPSADASSALFGGEAFSFKDIFDVINPLQQLPVVSSLYRSATGDTISTGARLAGGFLLGGPIGFMIAALNAGLESSSGNDIGGHMLAMMEGDAERQYALRAYGKAGTLG